VKTSIRRHPERAVPGEAAQILAAGSVAHVGFVEDGQPYVIPLLYHFEPERPNRLWLHGSRGSRIQRQLGRGTPVCVSVALVDGLVASKDAQFHSANYRSVVVFGRARPVPDAEKAALFERMTARYFAGRAVGTDYAPPTAKELLATSVLEVEIDEWSAKARRGGPAGPRDDDADEPGTAGVYPPPAA
jgi:nitroimidazol reductase NimA-like FMN-containing flavoprotein (pyridoxamine 5'-phosphate oxidase superfamily)